MNTLTSQLAWTLIHSMWQGVVVAIFLLVALRLMCRASAHARYVVSCGAVTLLLFACVTTLVIMRPRSATVVNTTRSIGRVDSVEIDTTVAASLAPSRQEPNRHTTVLQWVVLAWIAGVTVLAIRHTIGWLLLQRLRRRARCTRFDSLLDELQSRLGMSRVIPLIDTSRIDVPAVVGVFKPVILVPLGVMNDLSPRQIEAILAHELAHIHRHDYLINLLQTAIETLMFYHPAVWWMSHRIRIERENCCDDIAAAACGDAHQYASALAQLESLRGPRLALAASGGDLLLRVRRLLQLPALPRRLPTTHSLAAAALILSCLVLPLLAVNKTTAPTATTAPATQPTCFIRIVIGHESIFIDGKRTDWIAVKQMLDAMPAEQRKQTILEIAAASDM